MNRNKAKIGVLMVNVGTPDSPSTADVRKYLREFLMDKRVMDIPFVSRWLLINLIIAPFRAPKSAAEYRKLWTDRGSPLLYHAEDLRDKLRTKLDTEKYQIEIAMRYQSPSIQDGLDKLKKEDVKQILVLPLFPQYASATSGTVSEKIMDIVQTWEVIPTITFINDFVDHPLFLEAWAKIGEEMLAKEDYDTFLFSYHGLPERQIRRSSVDGYCQLNDKCCSVKNKKNQFCYRGQSFYTTRIIAERLGLPKDKVITSFQSRLLKDPWIRPYTDEMVKKLAAEGKKKVLAFSPAFVADCLETTVEVGMEYQEEFLALGGEKWDLVPSLNSTDTWVDCVKQMVLDGSTPNQ